MSRRLLTFKHFFAAEPVSASTLAYAAGAFLHLGFVNRTPPELQWSRRKPRFKF